MVERESDLENEPPIYQFVCSANFKPRRHVSLEKICIYEQDENTDANE